MFVRDLKTGRLLRVVIGKASKDEVSSLTNDFDFQWVKLLNQTASRIYAIKLVEESNEVLGLLHLVDYQGMLIMNLVEVSKSNIGRKKRYDYIAGCLIAFACKRSFNLVSEYKGFLTFSAKSELANLYRSKYYARQINGHRMYIDPESGIRLIDEYLNRKK